MRLGRDSVIRELLLLLPLPLLDPWLRIRGDWRRSLLARTQILLHRSLINRRRGARVD
jgi:hypothetical protein